MKDQKVNKAAVAGIAGAVIGAAAVAATVVLKDEENRKKVKDAMNDVKDQARDFIEAQSDQIDQIDAEQVIDDSSDKAHHVVDKAKDKVEGAKEKADK